MNSKLTAGEGVVEDDEVPKNHWESELALQYNTRREPSRSIIVVY